MDHTAVWLATAKRHAHPPVERILDLGSGAGAFSAPLADTFDADVLAVEPDEGRRAQAATHERVTTVDGHAGKIPADDGSIDLAWLSGVAHHIDDLPAAAREIARVMRPGGTVMIREDRTAGIIEAFEAAGFTHFFRERIEPLDLIVIR
jgi:ubiquinone/menaquinone biosynthesis C-methylase UbiE